MRPVSKALKLKTSLWLISLYLLLVGSAVAGPLRIDGKLTQGGILIGEAAPGASVWLDEKALRVNADGVFVAGLARDAKPEITLKVHYADGQEDVRKLQIVQRKFHVQRIDGLPQRKVTPTSKADLARIRRDGKLVRKARAIDTDREDFLQDFIWPVTGRISGVYGSQRVLNGKPKRPHFGVDVARPTGTLVRAPADGVVILAEPDLFYSGGTILIDHGMRMNTSYLHLSKLLVKKGDQVKQGDLIGEIGKTGRATGPHLHWGANVGNVRIDPALLVPLMPQN